MIQEPLPSADCFDEGSASDVAGWAKRTAEELAGAAGPAPAPADRVVLPPKLQAVMRGVSVNPANHPWEAANIVSPAEAMAMEQQLKAWCRCAAGGAGEIVPLDEMDAEQRFAYDINVFKTNEREQMQSSGRISKYRAQRLIVTGPAGSGKSRTVRAIAHARRCHARKKASAVAGHLMQSPVPMVRKKILKQIDDAARLACMLGSPFRCSVVLGLCTARLVSGFMVSRRPKMRTRWRCAHEG